jgi:hypothetical protein
MIVRSRGHTQRLKYSIVHVDEKRRHTRALGNATDLTINFVSDSNEVVFDVLFELLLQHTGLHNIALDTIYKNLLPRGVCSLHTLLRVKWSSVFKRLR